MDILNLKRSIDAAYLEFEKEPMDDYYNHKFIGYVSRLRIKKILEELGEINGTMILDIGCEAGYLSTQLALKGAEVVPIDICKPALLTFKQNLEKNETELYIRSPILSIAHMLPLKIGSFDSVVCSEVIEHLPSVDIIFQEVNMVMKDKGLFVLTFPNEKIRRKIYPILKFWGINTDIEEEVTLFSYSINEIEGKCNRFFEVIKSYVIPSRFLPLTNVIICKKKKEKSSSDLKGD